VAAHTAPRGPAGEPDGVLLRRWRCEGDRGARAALIERHLPLARRLARRYVGRGDGGEDLAQVAALGLIKAIDRFDPDRGLALSTFAVPTILGELKRHLRDTSWAVRVPRDLQELALRVDDLGDRLERALGRPPTVAELARAVPAPVEDVLEALAALSAHRALSLDAPRGGEEDGGGVYADCVGGEDPRLAGAEDRALLSPLLGRLPPREREIVRLRFAEDLTQHDIGRRLGISQMHVSRLLRRALATAAASASSP
jgi:RNA polymerase sigma-B factor